MSKVKMKLYGKHDILSSVSNSLMRNSKQDQILSDLMSGGFDKVNFADDVAEMSHTCH